MPRARRSHPVLRRTPWPPTTSPRPRTCSGPAPSRCPTPDDPRPPIPLTEPRDGVPRPIDRRGRAGRRGPAALAAGTGPVAVDAERASGYRYGQRAYLVQLRRDDVGTVLIDPVALPDLSARSAPSIADDEWVLHAASQDLPCLAELGLRPTRRLRHRAGRAAAGLRRGSGSASIVEEVLGLTLEKGHSAADWSTRPLPEPWLRYAALDVEVLVELRDALAAELDEQGKRELGRGGVRRDRGRAARRPPRVDPWRRTSGMHRVRRRRQLAVVRALWERRDELARARDISPGRVLPDAAIVEAALAAAADGRRWRAARITGRGAAPAERDLVARRRSGRSRCPRAPLPPEDKAARGAAAGPAVGRARPGGRGPAGRRPQRPSARSPRRTGCPVENLLSPDAVRRLAWEPPQPVTDATVATALRGHGARPWQVELTGAALAEALH